MSQCSFKGDPRRDRRPSIPVPSAERLWVESIRKDSTCGGAGRSLKSISHHGQHQFFITLPMSGLGSLIKLSELSTRPQMAC